MMVEKEKDDKRNGFMHRTSLVTKLIILPFYGKKGHKLPVSA
jgi:hypothetical protein